MNFCRRVVEEQKAIRGGVVKRLTKSMVFIISLNSLVLAVFIFSTWCYADVFHGQDPLALIFIPFFATPALLVLGIVLLVFGKRFQIPLFNRLIPFIGMVALWLALSGGNLLPSRNGFLVGTCIGIALSILTIATAVRIVISKQKRGQTSPPN